MTALRKRQFVKLSILEYDDRFIPVPLFSMCIGLMVGFTAIFNVLGYIFVPIAVFVIFSIINGDINLVGESSETSKRYGTEEE